MPYDAEIHTADEVAAENATKAALHRAAAIIRAKGLVQHMPISSNGRVCTLQALGEAIGASFNEAAYPYIFGAKPHVKAAMDEINATSTGDLCMWNNVSGRTAEDVACMFERAAAKL